MYPSTGSQIVIWKESQIKRNASIDHTSLALKIIASVVNCFMCRLLLVKLYMPCLWHNDIAKPYAIHILFAIRGQYAGLSIIDWVVWTVISTCVCCCGRICIGTDAVKSIRSSLILYQTALVSSLAPIGQLTDHVDRNLAPISKRRSVIDDSNECVLRTVSTAAIRLHCNGCRWTVGCSDGCSINRAVQYHRAISSTVYQTVQIHNVNEATLINTAIKVTSQ